MARITVEDCVEQVSNRFQLVQMAAIRAKQLKRGATPLVDRGDNKEVVVALREIAEGFVRPDEAGLALLKAEADGLPQPDLAALQAEATAAAEASAAVEVPTGDLPEVGGGAAPQVPAAEEPKTV